jgi:hypothetical protein
MVGGSILIFILLITLIIYYCKIKQAADREDQDNDEVIMRGENYANNNS